MSQNHIHQTQPWISGATHLHLQKHLLVSPQIPTPGTQQDSAASDLMKQVLKKVETLQMALQGLKSLSVNSLQQCKMCKLPKYLNCKIDLLTWNAQQQLNANYNNVSPVTCLSCSSVKEESFRILPMSGCNLQHLRSATPQLVCNARWNLLQMSSVQTTSYCNQ